MPLDSTANSASKSEGSIQQPLVPVTARGQATRRRLLDAAEQEFGSRGFHVASVSSITGRAGVGQGTFYLYFHSKEEIFVTLVSEIAQALRTALREAWAVPGTRLECERAGMSAFFTFCSQRPGSFRIIQEARFVDPAVYRQYHETLAEDYEVSLRAAQSQGQIREGDCELRAWALLGMMHYVGMRSELSGTSAPAGEAVDELARLIGEGLVAAA